MPDKLYARNISKTYKTKKVLSDVSLTLNRGEVVGLFGPNGAGKTTCFSIIIGLMKGDSGKLFLNDRDITRLPIYLRSKFGFGYLPQESSVFRGLSVGDNIKVILELSIKNKVLIEQKIDTLLADFSIMHLKHAPAMRLSGGEKRRLEIARVLASNPKFIMFDEPLAGIDPLAILDIKHLITHLKSLNIGILITDHNVRDTLDIVDRAYVMFNGTILLEGTPEEVSASQKVKEVYLGEAFRLSNQL